MSGQSGLEFKRYQQSLSDAFHHLTLDAGFTQDEVWSDAGLTTVHKLTPRDTTAHKQGMETLINSVDYCEYLY